MGPHGAPARRGDTALNRIRIGQVWIDQLTFEQALDAIEALAREGRGGFVLTPNVDHLVVVEREPALRAAYDECALSLVDGMPVLWASRLLGTPLPEKISGSDFGPRLLERAAKRGDGVYLLGGGEGAAAKAAELIRKSPGVNVVGAEGPRIGMEPLPDEAEIVARIRAAKPAYVLVGLGAPKQERFMQRNAEALAPAVCMGIGATIDFLAGAVRRAPGWMSRSGLEWLYRLAQEPRRLAYRYLVQDPRFLAIVWRTMRIPRAERVKALPSAAPAP